MVDDNRRRVQSRGYFDQRTGFDSFFWADVNANPAAVASFIIIIKELLGFPRSLGEEKMSVFDFALYCYFQFFFAHEITA